MRNFILIGLLLWLISGCAGSGSFVPITDTMVTESGEVVTTTAGYTKDASIAKEHDVHDTLRNRDIMYARMYSTSGTKLEFEMVEVSPGVKIQVLKSITQRDAPNFEQKLPTAPSVHPVWHTVENVVESVGKFSLMAYGINALSNVWQAGLDSAEMNVGGDYNIESHNATAEPFVFSGEELTPFAEGVELGVAE